MLRVGELVRHALAGLFARGEIEDDLLAGKVITVPEVRMSPDLKLASAYVMPLGGEQAAEIVQFGFCRRTGDGDGERHAQRERYGDEYANSGEPRPDNGHRAHGALAPAKMSLDSKRNTNRAATRVAPRLGSLRRVGTVVAVLSATSQGKHDQPHSPLSG